MDLIVSREAEHYFIREQIVSCVDKYHELNFMDFIIDLADSESFFRVLQQWVATKVVAEEDVKYSNVRPPPRAGR